MAWLAHGSGTWIVAAFALATGLLGFGLRTGRAWLAWLSLGAWVLLGFLVWFFRDPERSIASGLCSPADGKVVRIDHVDDPDLGPCDRLSIFMSPLDVHVNRVPAPARVAAVTHRPGKHIPAFDKDSDRNERVETLLTARHPLKVVQIAGAVARRIVVYLVPDDEVAQGQRLGMIRLGSRCDLLAPAGTLEWTVPIGAQVRAGASQVAEWRTP